jgi:hypothetical protein
LSLEIQISEWEEGGDISFERREVVSHLGRRRWYLICEKGDGISFPRITPPHFSTKYFTEN